MAAFKGLGVFPFRRISGTAVFYPVEKDLAQVVSSYFSEGKTRSEEFLPNYSFCGNNLTWVESVWIQTVCFPTSSVESNLG